MCIKFGVDCSSNFQSADTQTQTLKEKDLQSYFFYSLHLLARDVIYTSCAYATISVSVCLSVSDGSALAH